MRNLIVLFLVSLTLSCDNDNDDNLPVVAACAVDNPIKDLLWLTEEVERREANPTVDSRYCYIVQGVSNDQTIFIYEDCNPLVNKIFTIYDCSGELIGFLGDENFTNENISNRRVIYKPELFVCEL